MKKCPKCKMEKSESDFWKEISRKDGLHGLCKSCCKENNQKWRKTKSGIESAKKRQARRTPRDWMCLNLKYLYGITVEQKNEILFNQKEMCAICFCKLSITGSHVDHDHLTDKIRGLLCSNCNTGLGLFKDSEVNLQNAIKYLVKTKS